MLSDCEQVFEDVGRGASWSRPGLNHLKAAFQPGDCVKAITPDRLEQLGIGGTLAAGDALEPPGLPRSRAPSLA